MAQQDATDASASTWIVVGGQDVGGILVRQSCDATSPQEPQRLAHGATVSELEVVGERLRYRLLSGIGPPTGWVTIRLKHKPLLERRGAPADGFPAPSPSPSPVAGPRVVDRRLRALAVHSAPSNSNILKFQTTKLRQAFGRDVDWTFVDSPNLWEPRAMPGGNGEPTADGAWELYGGERTDVERRLAGAKPFVEWLRFEDSPSVPTPGSVEASYAHLRSCLRSPPAVDFVVALSQGSAILAGLMEQMRAEREDVPWRMSIFFCSVPPEAHALADCPSEKFDHPVVAVLGGQSDPWYTRGKAGLLGRYASPTILEHEDGHAFPFTEPGASSIYSTLAATVRSALGAGQPGEA